MKGLADNNNLLLYIISNSIAIVMLIVSLKRIRLARLLFAIIFAWASWTNWHMALNDPRNYLGEAELALIPWYREFILGWFSRHITLMVGTIATCQAMIAGSMFLRNGLLKTGAAGAIIFLLAIAPLGVGSGFPCTVILAIAMWQILQARHQSFLWQRPVIA